MEKKITLEDIMVFMKQTQQNQVTLHERLARIEKLMEPENIDVTPLISEPLIYYKRKRD